MKWQTVAPSDEVEAADWIHGRLHPFAQDVGSVVPVGFAAYARIFHPASVSGADRPEVEARWSDVAAGNGKTVHPEMQFHAISAPGRQPRVYEPRLGVLSDRQAGALVGLLSKHTATPKPAGCAFGRATATSTPVQWLRSPYGPPKAPPNRLGLGSGDSALAFRRRRLEAFRTANG